MNVKRRGSLRNEISAKTRAFSACFHPAKTLEKTVRQNEVMIITTSSMDYPRPCLYHVLAAITGDRMGSVMESAKESAKGSAKESAKQRPANVPVENVYSRMHWMVVVTYVVAIGAIAMLMIGAG